MMSLLHWHCVVLCFCNYCCRTCMSVFQHCCHLFERVQATCCVHSTMIRTCEASQEQCTAVVVVFGCCMYIVRDQVEHYRCCELNTPHEAGLNIRMPGHSHELAPPPLSAKGAQQSELLAWPGAGPRHYANPFHHHPPVPVPAAATLTGPGGPSLSKCHAASSTIVM